MGRTKPFDSLYTPGIFVKLGDSVPNGTMMDLVESRLVPVEFIVN